MTEFKLGLNVGAVKKEEGKQTGRKGYYIKSWKLAVRRTCAELQPIRLVVISCIRETLATGKYLVPYR